MKVWVPIAATLAGVAITWLAEPFLVRHLPNDRAQISVVIARMRTHPKLAVVGNSVAMYGVQVEQNLATPGQMIEESVMLASELRDTRTIVMVVTPWQLATSSTLNAQGWNAWWMYGLRPSEETRALVGMPEMSDAVERFRSRWIFRAAFETFMRRMAGNRRPHLPDVWRGSETFYVGARQRRLIESIAAHRNVVVVLAPLSPVVRAHYGDAFKSVRFANTRTIDASELLHDEFRDATHPNEEGARILTRFIVERL
jgi:hypothetical protein